ncbi:MAG: ATP-binding cassette domain-containing protein [Eubacteriales bacterium]|nr:ATP-binding cassette domain-containing protein [Eubacteriales bacterium]
MSSRLELTGISKTFQKGTLNEKVALDNITFTANPGDFVTVLGSNGAGKSTLFNAVLGIFLTDKGRILLDGEDITFKKQHKRAGGIGCLFQNPLRGTAPNMTIEENLALAYHRHSSYSFFAVNRRDADYFKEVLSTLGMGLENRLKTKMGVLSGGQRQAASLLMATVARPKLLLLDEHTASLDPATAEKVLAITKQIVEREKITTLMITHDMSYALNAGNRTIAMDGGRIVFDISGERREAMTPDDLIKAFRENSVNSLDDRTVLTKKPL